METHANLIIVRHGQSQWNLENRFTGWADVPLTEKGINEAMEAGKAIKETQLIFDLAYTSVLTRAIHTLWEILKVNNLNWLPTIKDYRLNERHYGALTGLNKKETAEKYGKEQVHEWRRSFETLPPQLDMSDERHPIFDKRYKNMLPASDLPAGESLEITLNRFLPLWDKEILPKLKNQKNILISAHGNSLRALMLKLEGISPEKITEVEIDTGVPIWYTLDKEAKIIEKKVLIK